MLCTRSIVALLSSIKEGGVGGVCAWLVTVGATMKRISLLLYRPGDLGKASERMFNVLTRGWDCSLHSLGLRICGLILL